MRPPHIDPKGRPGSLRDYLRPRATFANALAARAAGWTPCYTEDDPRSVPVLIENAWDPYLRRMGRTFDYYPPAGWVEPRPESEGWFGSGPDDDF